MDVKSIEKVCEKTIQYEFISDWIAKTKGKII